MKRKFDLFLKNAGFLQEAFAVTPLLYGSLGLAVLTGEELRPEDIDILLPERMLSEEWQPFKTVLEANGYLLADEKEHTFQKDGVAYSYASLEELEHFAGIPLQEISLREERGVRFYLLSPEQYLAVYRKSSLDGYRVNTRCKKDGEKIALLEHYVAKNKRKERTPMKTEAFKNRKVNTGKLLEYGFVLAAGVYVYRVPLVGGQMELTVEVSPDGEVATKVADIAFGEEYVLHLVPHAEGAFVGQVRTEYSEILDDIAKKCFDLHIFREEQSRALIRHVEETYGDELEFLWEKLPMAAVWRRKDNRKWYATVMTLKASKLLPEGDGMIEVMDLRIKPEEVNSTVDGKRFFPGYHMNKRHWYTVILDGSVPTEELFLRIAESYRLAKK